MSKILDDKSILEIMCNDADSEVEFDSDDDMEEPVFSELTPLDRSVNNVPSSVADRVKNVFV